MTTYKNMQLATFLSRLRIHVFSGGVETRFPRLSFSRFLGLLPSLLVFPIPGDHCAAWSLDLILLRPYVSYSFLCSYSSRVPTLPVVLLFPMFLLFPVFILCVPAFLYSCSTLLIHSITTHYCYTRSLQSITTLYRYTLLLYSIIITISYHHTIPILHSYRYHISKAYKLDYRTYT